MIDKPVIVCSPPRSGSSLTTMVLNECGLWVGNTKQGDEYNPKGYYENLAVTKCIVEHMREQDRDNLGKRFHPNNLEPAGAEFETRIKKSVEEQGYCGKQSWMFKDPKNSFVWRSWDKWFPECRFLIVTRDETSTVNSMMKTPFMDAYNTRSEWHGLIKTYKEIHSNIQAYVGAGRFERLNVEMLFDEQYDIVSHILSGINIHIDPMELKRSCKKHLIR